MLHVVHYLLVGTCIVLLRETRSSRSHLHFTWLLSFVRSWPFHYMYWEERRNNLPSNSTATMVRRHKLPYWIEAAVPLHRDDIDDLSITTDEAAFLHEFFHNEAPRQDGEGEDDLDLAGWVVVCGNLAVMMSLLYTLAPLPTVYDIYSRKDVGKLPLLPFSIMVIKAFMWFVYGALKSQRMLWVPNLVSLPLSIWCFCVYTRYSPQESTQLPGTVMQHVGLILGLFAITSLSAVVLPPWIAVQAVGLQAVLICVIRDWSPLVRLKEVLQTKNADSLSAPMSIAGCFDCALWAIFGKMGMDDALVYVPNTIRLGFTALQVVLLAMYGSWAREKRKNRSKKGGSLKRNNSDTFEGLLANIDGAERDDDDDQTIATNTTMSTAGTGGSSRRSVQMQNMHKAGHRRDNDRFDDNDHHATEKKERPMRHRHLDALI